MKKERQIITIVLPANWNLKKHACERGFLSVQEYIRTLIRRDMGEEKNSGG